MRIAVLRNPGSSRNAGHPAPTAPEGVEHIDLTGLDDLPQTLCALRRVQTDLLVIDGGDGTVREIVSLLPDIFDEDMPAVGIVANGNTNLIARNCGSVRSYDALASLTGRTRSDLTSHCNRVRLLRIEGLDERTVRGFIAGWGAYTSGTRIAVEEISARGGRQVIRAVLAVLRRVTIGSNARELRVGVRVQSHSAGYEGLSGNGFAGIITVLEGRLVAGLSPFWGSGPGAIRWLHVAAPPRHLLLAAPFIALGRPLDWMLRTGYHSGRTDEVSLCVDGGLVVDGEIFATQADQALRLTADEILHVATL